MEKYNTQLSHITLPEYGRNVQHLVEYCITIPDRNRRNQFAATIISIMQDVFPEIGKGEDAQHTLWDHLAMISNYRLDIDYPYPIERKEEGFRPQPIALPQQRMRFRMYGRVVENMIQKAATLPTREERISLFEYCANHMKRNFHLTNPDAEEDDEKIISDLIGYAGEEFAEECYEIFLFTSKELIENDQFDASKLEEVKKKKKKKKKK